MPAAETQTLTRAISILDCFSPDQSELGVREIARRVGLSRSTVGRLLATMHAAGILGQNPTTRTYAMGAKVLTWAGVYAATLDVRVKARPILEHLHRMTRETVSLYILDGCERVCVERLESPEGLRFVVRVGERMPLHAGASGKVLLAFLPPDQRREILRAISLTPLTGNTITSIPKLERELALVRKRGYAASVGERVVGGTSVAAPVRGASGDVLAALNLTAPTPRVSDEKILDYVKWVTQAAAQISREMGYMPPGREEIPSARGRGPSRQRMARSLS